jgi:hypothetical protein
MMPDWKNIGTKAIDIVAGVGGAVAGAYGGPAAASGVQQAGGAIKSLVEDGGGAPKQTRSERFDRADFQARKKSPPVTLGDADTTRAELTRLGWTPEQIDTILSGPKPQAEPKPEAEATGQTTGGADWKAIAAAVGSQLKGALGNQTDTSPAIATKSGTAEKTTANPTDSDKG